MSASAWHGMTWVTSSNISHTKEKQKEWEPLLRDSENQGEESSQKVNWRSSWKPKLVRLHQPLPGALLPAEHTIPLPRFPSLPTLVPPFWRCRPPSSRLNLSINTTYYIPGIASRADHTAELSARNPRFSPVGQLELLCTLLLTVPPRHAIILACCLFSHMS